MNKDLEEYLELYDCLDMVAPKFWRSMIEKNYLSYVGGTILYYTWLLAYKLEEVIKETGNETITKEIFEKVQSEVNHKSQDMPSNTDDIAVSTLVYCWKHGPQLLNFYTWLDKGSHLEKRKKVIEHESSI